ncbi:MAG: hypothetical protein J7K26_02585 [Candidatus Aenigmarchaeota archaeon]|nr:hypothetical protein [Candidatus Aenigmarchaeota archaeon]
MAQKQGTFLYQQRLDGTKALYFRETDITRNFKQLTLDHYNNGTTKLPDFYRPKLSDF